MARWDSRFFGTADPAVSREQVEAQWLAYLDGVHTTGRSWSYAMRHALGLWNGTPGARRWRQVWSDHRLKAWPPHKVMALAHQPAETEPPEARPSGTAWTTDLFTGVNHELA